MTGCCPFCGAEYALTEARCWECKVALAEEFLPTLVAEKAVEEVLYELDDWSVASRVELTTTLAQQGIPSRWEPGLTLAVREVDDEAAERALDELEESIGEGDDDEGDDGDGDDEDGDGDGDNGDGDNGGDRDNRGDGHGHGGDGDDGGGDGDEGGGDGDDDDDGTSDDVDGEAVAQAAMADLFVAADRLMHEPGNELVAAELGVASGIVGESRPPFGIEDQLWTKVQELSALICGHLDDATASEVVAGDARTLREVLRPYV